MTRAFTIGTAEDCDVRVNDDPYVSSHHARVTVDDTGMIRVEDLGSTNGTYLQKAGGSARIRVWAPQLMQPGDTLWLGGRTAIPWNTDPNGAPR